MKFAIALVLLMAPAFSQQLSNTGPVNATPNGATVNQTFTAAGSPGVAVAGLQFEVPAGVSMPTAVNLGTKTLLCEPTTRRCIIYGLNDNTIPTSILSSFAVTASGSYGLANVIGGTVTGSDATVTTGPPLVVTLPTSKCDINKDGALSAADQDLLALYLVKPSIIPAGTVTDINGNGVFNTGDVQFLGRVIRGLVSCPE